MTKNIVFGLVIVVGVVAVFADMKKHEIAVDRVVINTDGQSGINACGDCVRPRRCRL